MSRVLRGMALILLAIQVNLTIANENLVTPSKYYAFSMYNFIKFINWPSNYKNQDFIIGIVGSEPVFKELEQLASTRKYGNFRYKIIYYKKPSEIVGFHHMIYLSNSHSGKIAMIKEISDSDHTMFVTEREGMCNFGAAVSFYVSERGRIEFEVSKNNLIKQDLVLNSQILKLAGKVSP